MGAAAGKSIQEEKTKAAADLVQALKRLETAGQAKFLNDILDNNKKFDLDSFIRGVKHLAASKSTEESSKIASSLKNLSDADLASVGEFLAAEEATKRMKLKKDASLKIEDLNNDDDKVSVHSYDNLDDSTESIQNENKSNQNYKKKNNNHLDENVGNNSGNPSGSNLVTPKKNAEHHNTHQRINSDFLSPLDAIPDISQHGKSPNDLFKKMNSHGSKSVMDTSMGIKDIMEESYAVLLDLENAQTPVKHGNPHSFSSQSDKSAYVSQIFRQNMLPPDKGASFLVDGGIALPQPAAQGGNPLGLQMQKVWSLATNAQLEREVEALQRQLKALETWDWDAAASKPVRNPTEDSVSVANNSVKNISSSNSNIPRRQVKPNNTISSNSSNTNKPLNNNVAENKHTVNNVYNNNYQEDKKVVTRDFEVTADTKQHNLSVDAIPAPRIGGRRQRSDRSLMPSDEHNNSSPLRSNNNSNNNDTRDESNLDDSVESVSPPAPLIKQRSKNVLQRLNTRRRRHTVGGGGIDESEDAYIMSTPSKKDGDVSDVQTKQQYHQHGVNNVTPTGINVPTSTSSSATTTPTTATLGAATSATITNTNTNAIIESPDGLTKDIDAIAARASVGYGGYVKGNGSPGSQVVAPRRRRRVSSYSSHDQSSMADSGHSTSSNSNGIGGGVSGGSGYNAMDAEQEVKMAVKDDLLGSAANNTNNTNNNSNISSSSTTNTGAANAASVAGKRGKKDVKVTESKANKSFNQELENSYLEVTFLLRRQLDSEAALTYTQAATEAAVLYIEQLNQVSVNCQVPRGMLTRWILPYDDSTRIDEQCSTPSGVLQKAPLALRDKIPERQVHYLVRGANSLRQLVRVKIADDNDLQQASRALDTAKHFLKLLDQEAQKDNCRPYQVLQKLQKLHG